MLVIRPSECVLRVHFLALKAKGRLDPADPLTTLAYGIVPGSLHLPAPVKQACLFRRTGGVMLLLQVGEKRF
jgi:hypothetical protein